MPLFSVGFTGGSLAGVIFPPAVLYHFAGVGAILQCGQYYTSTPVFSSCIRARRSACFIEYARHCFSIGDITLGGALLVKLSKMPQRRSSRKNLSVTIVTFCSMVIYQCVVLCIWTFYNNKCTNNHKTVYKLCVNGTV